MDRTTTMFLALRHAHEWKLAAEFRVRLRAAMVAAGLGP